MKPASTTIAEIRGGKLNDELSEALRELTTAVQETGQAGTVTLTLKIKPFDEDGAVSRVTIADDIKVKAPKKAQRETIMFIDPKTADLSRNDPQLTIPGVKTEPAKAG